jgi:hypothetical protein
LLIRASSLLLGFFFIASGSAGLKDNAVAGSPSVTRLTHNNYIELNPSGIPKNEEKNIEATSPIFDDIMYLIKALFKFFTFILE